MLVCLRVDLDDHNFTKILQASTIDINRCRSVILVLHRDELFLVSNLLRQLMVETVPPVLNKILRLMNCIVSLIDLIDLPKTIQEQFVASIGTWIC